MPVVTLRAVSDFAALEAPWRELEARSEASFFQSWTWVGCLAAHRFRRAVLLEATQAGQTIALGLFNHRPALMSGGSLWLGETGRAALDAVFVEHNGLLIAHGAEGVLNACLAAACTLPIAPRTRGRRRALRLNGVGDAVLKAAKAVANGTVQVQTRSAPYVDLVALGDRTHLDMLGSSTRYSVRRSVRRYQQRGPLRLELAQSVDEALAFLDGLASLHQLSWTDRGKPGAFANPEFVRFHRQLVRCGQPRSEVELWRLSAGDAVVGYLYDFRLAGRVYAYQSGFDYRHASQHERPGLTAHHLVIEQCRKRGDLVYDFLGGSDRYKTSFATHAASLHWIMSQS